jgi:hypothetical protein
VDDFGSAWVAHATLTAAIPTVPRVVDQSTVGGFVAGAIIAGATGYGAAWQQGRNRLAEYKAGFEDRDRQNRRSIYSDYLERIGEVWGAGLANDAGAWDLALTRAIACRRDLELHGSPEVRELSFRMEDLWMRAVAEAHRKHREEARANANLAALNPALYYPGAFVAHQGEYSTIRRELVDAMRADVAGFDA